MERIYIGLGANLGDGPAVLRRAAERLRDWPGCRWVAASTLYVSAPVDSEGPDYWNAVVALDTRLTPQAVLAALQAMEREHGRKRPYRNAPRTLDLDLLAFGQMVARSPALTLPHPRLHQRAFVLKPLLDIEHDLSLPGLGALAQYLPDVADQRLNDTGEALDD
jgi:2-amino-4-hydroxy-6-hydroxymethyldihydropteridine diphosphokinase